MINPLPARIAARMTALAVCCGAVLIVTGLSFAQVIGNEAELDRLRAKAEEAMANEDPEGAAMNMGRAALMAKVLAKTHQDDASTARLFQGGELLFRAQEHSYRAMALFRRAGGQLPASSGVCGSLALAKNSLQQAIPLLQDDRRTPNQPAAQATQFRETAADWNTVIESIITDYQCP